MRKKGGEENRSVRRKIVGMCVVSCGWVAADVRQKAVVTCVVSSGWVAAGARRKAAGTCVVSFGCVTPGMRRKTVGTCIVSFGWVVAGVWRKAVVYPANAHKSNLKMIMFWFASGPYEVLRTINPADADKSEGKGALKSFCFGLFM